MKKFLSEDEINERLSELKDWVFLKNKIQKSYNFKGFRDAMSFILRLSFEAEEKDHHPEIFNCYNRVEISLSTHDAGGNVTEKDFLLARAIDSVC